MAKRNAKNKLTKKELKTKIVKANKFERWTEYFLDEKNQTTFGNATQSALKVYNAKNDNTAGVIGHENLRKLKNVAGIYADKKGIGYGKMIDIAVRKMIEGKSPEWWDRLMKIFGYEDFIGKGQAVVNVDQRKMYVVLPPEEKVEQ